MLEQGKMVIYRMNYELKITHLSFLWVDFDENFQHKMEKGLLIFKRFLTTYDYNNISQPMNIEQYISRRIKIIRYIKLVNYKSKNKTNWSWITIKNLTEKGI